GGAGHSWINWMSAIGGITVLIGAALAFVQDDIKKVLAYSTISQLGYMVMALGVGAWTAAVFHLFTHAFFKANLFLGAGSVSHSGAHHSFDMKKDMGGLRTYMPKTYATFLVGTAALIGLPLTGGFFSKDEILAVAGENGFTFFKVVGLAGVAGIAIAYAFYWKRAFGQNASERNPALHAGKQFLVKKYFLDILYTDILIGGIKGPIANAAYWINQNVIDNVLRYTGKGTA